MVNSCRLWLQRSAFKISKIVAASSLLSNYLKAFSHDEHTELCNHVSDKCKDAHGLRLRRGIRNLCRAASDTQFAMMLLLSDEGDSRHWLNAVGHIAHLLGASAGAQVAFCAERDDHFATAM